MSGEWPLAGRSEELCFIENQLRRRGKGPAPGLVLAGPAGVGKTRLAREALAAAAGRGVLVRWAMATTSARPLPLGAFAPLLAGTAVTHGGQTGPVAYEAVPALLRGAPQAGVVLAVDDAHLLDDLSASLLHQVVVERAATVVVTVRTGERAPDAVTALWKDEHLQRLELKPMSEAETGDVLEAALGGQVESRTLSRLWSITGGNMLYLRELTAGEIDCGNLRQMEGVWQWRGQLHVRPRLAELIDARLGRLSDELLRVVELLAFGEPLELSLLARLDGLEAAERVERVGLVTVVHDGRRLFARLAHPLFGEMARAGIGTLRARRLCGELADALAATGTRRSGDTLRRALLAIDSDRDGDPDLLVDAANMAANLLDFPLAERLARAALAAGGGFDAQLALIYTLTWQGRGDEADEEARALEPLTHTDRERVRATIPRAGNLFWVVGDTDEAQSVLRTLEGSVSDPAALVDIAALRAPMALHRNRLTRARSLATQILSAPQPSDQAIVLATWALVGALALGGRADEIDAARRRADRTAQRFDTSHLRRPVTDFAITGLWLAGRLAEARRLVESSYQLSGAKRGQEFTANLFLSQVVLASGAVRTGSRLLKEARAGYEGCDPAHWIYRCLIELAEASSMAGDAAAAREALDEAEEACPPCQELLRPRLGLARAWVAAAEGSTSEAIAHARSAAACAADSEQFAVEVLALHTAVCFGDSSVARRLAELAGVVQGPRPAAAAAHAAALAAGDGDALDAASARIEAFGARLLAADAAAQASQAHHRCARQAMALASAARAHRLAEECEGARTPALIAAARPLPLTSREREIVTLAAHGLANREIASRLVVSVRTVEGHIYRASAKLGVSDRSEFAAQLGG